MRAVFDTCILVDYLKGLRAAQEALDRSDEPWISVLTWADVLSKAADDDELRVLRGFLDGFHVYPVTTDVANEAVRIHRSTGAGVSEAIALATARVLGCELVTWYPGDSTASPTATGPDPGAVRANQRRRRSTAPPEPAKAR